MVLIIGAGDNRKKIALASPARGSLTLRGAMRGSTHKRRDKRNEERIDKRTDKRIDECVVEGCVLSGSAPTLGERGTTAF